MAVLRAQGLNKRFNQTRALDGVLSGRANLELLATLDGPGAPARVDAVLERVSLSARAQDRVSGYSTGMRQRLAIAAALLRSPRLLLLDEPTSGLDPAGARQVREPVRDLAADGVAVLVSSHLIEEIQDVCQTFTVLNRGQVVWRGTIGQLRDQAPPSEYTLHTSDDARALELVRPHPGVRAARNGRDGLSLTAGEDELDRYVLALGSAGVAVRRLELRSSPLGAAVLRRAADDARCPRPERREPAVHDLRLLQHALKRDERRCCVGLSPDGRGVARRPRVVASWRESGRAAGRPVSRRARSSARGPVCASAGRRRSARAGRWNP
jgi:ABC-type multidrug transport system ATPase subunit